MSHSPLNGSKPKIIYILVLSLPQTTLIVMCSAHNFPQICVLREVRNSIRGLRSLIIQPPRSLSTVLRAHTHTHTTEDEPSCGLPLEEHGGTAALFFHPTQVHWNVKKTVALVFTLRSIRFNSQIVARLTHTTVCTFNGNTHISLLDSSGFCESFLLFLTIKKHYNIPVHISHGVYSKHQWLRLGVVFHSLLWLYGYSRAYHKVWGGFLSIVASMCRSESVIAFRWRSSAVDSCISSCACVETAAPWLLHATFNSQDAE